jgi:hypothetical protein
VRELQRSRDVAQNGNRSPIGNSPRASFARSDSPSTNGIV